MVLAGGGRELSRKQKLTKCTAVSCRERVTAPSHPMLAWRRCQRQHQRLLHIVRGNVDTGAESSDDRYVGGNSR